MLAEIFVLRLEGLLRTPIERTSFTKSDTRFVPIKEPVPEKEGKPQIDKSVAGLRPSPIRQSAASERGGLLALAVLS